MTKIVISTILLYGIIQIGANRLLQQIACTQEAKECPDGSFVGRTGPNCEFKPCPPCEVLQCLIPPCPCNKCPGGDNACLVAGNCANRAAVSCLTPQCGPDEEVATINNACCPGCKKKEETCCDPAEVQGPFGCFEGCACCPDGTWSGSIGDGKTFNCGGKTCGPDTCGGTVCGPDCSAVSCLRPVCNNDEVLVTPEGECCPKCQKQGRCRVPPEGTFGTCVEACPFNLECPNGQLCCSNGCGHTCQDPVFGPDCSIVRCALPKCPKGQVAAVPPGECCPQCQPDCSAVSCLKPVCQADEELVTPEGSCCPICQKLCPDPNTEYSQCAACAATCDNPKPICLAVCRPGCQCKAETPISGDGTCITIDGCDSEKVECETNKDCKDGYKCKPDPVCRNRSTPSKQLRCAAKKGVCLRSVKPKKNRMCATKADCPEGFQCKGKGVTGSGICVDYQSSP